MRTRSNVTPQTCKVVLRPLIQYCTLVQGESFYHKHYILPHTHVEDRARTIRGLRKWTHIASIPRNLLITNIWVASAGITFREWWKWNIAEAQLVPWTLEQRACTMLLIISGVVIMVQGWWYMDGYDMRPFYECYMRYGPHLTGGITPQTTSWPPTTPRTYSAVTLCIGRTKSLHHDPYYWCSSARMMMYVSV